MPARSTQRFLVLVVVVACIVLAATGLYMLGMPLLEGKPRSFWHSLSWAAETITTTGYGSDTRWDHPMMVLFVVALQFFGVVLIYMIVPIFLIPYIEERFEARLPREAPPKIENHVVIYRYGAAVESLLEELRQSRVDALIIETDETIARRLVEHGSTVVFGDTVAEALDGSRLPQARALIANGPDAEDAAAILIARQQGFKKEILALVEEPYHRQPMSLAGADAVYTPHHMLAAALAARASRRINPRVSGVQQLGRHLEVSEMRIDPHSDVVGKTLAEAHIGARTGTTVVGQWVAGRLITSPSPKMRLEPRGVLVALGRDEGLEKLARWVGGAAFASRTGPFIIGGYGQVGRKIHDLFTAVGEEVRVIDRNAGPDVDLVGDILGPGILEAAEPAQAQAVILALDSDSATLFATLFVRDRVPEVPIIARVNEASNVERIYRAGADFALSVSHVSGQILAQRLLRQESITLDPHLKVLKVPSDHLVGLHPSQLGIRERTGCSVVAVERDEDVLVSFPEEFSFAQGDSVYICGSTEGTQRFLRELKG